MATEKLFDDKPIPPGDHIRAELEKRGWTQDELASFAGCSRQHVNEIVGGKRGITPEMAVTLGHIFETSAKFWIDLDSSYRLSQVDAGDDAVKRRVRVYQYAPVREMQKRGWIAGDDLSGIEAELKRFFGVPNLDQLPEFPIATRKTAPLADLTPQQRAWCFRAREVAAALPSPKFSENNLADTEARLRKHAAYPAEAHKVADTLLRAGIRFVVVEPLQGGKIDGAAFWINESPVIAVSIRFDRIDAFWHTVMHEFDHVRRKDALSIDTDLAGDERNPCMPTISKDDSERMADAAAAAALVPTKELESFVGRVGPLYSRERIVQFAHRIKMHPGIIIGQLQHRGEIGYGAFRELFPKVRDAVVRTAVTDGYGQVFSPGTVGADNG